MLILVCGDRNWTDREAIHSRLAQLVSDEEVTVINGGARGADSIAGRIAKELGFVVVTVEADWQRYGRAAGPMRNRWMLDKKPDLVLAFHDDLSKSRGTADTVREATRRGIPVEIIKSRKAGVAQW